MTLIASMTGRPFAVMSSDRLVTLINARTYRFSGVHDPLANKMIVLVGIDHVICLSYCGSAYVGGWNTDNWILQHIQPDSGIFDNYPKIPTYGLKRSSRLRLHQICNRLRIGLHAAQGGRGVTILIAGWRVRRKRFIPVSLILKPAGRLLRDPDLRMKFVDPQSQNFGHIGANLYPQELEAAFKRHQLDTKAVNEEDVRAFLTDIIRSKSAIDQTVGANVMSTILYHPSLRRIDCVFDAVTTHQSVKTIEGTNAVLPVSYNPWIVLPSAYFAPAEATGQGAGILQSGDWTVEMKDAIAGPPTPSNIGWVDSQPRKPAR